MNHTFERGHGELRVTNDQNDSIGILFYTPKSKQTVHIDWLNIEPKFRKHGIATLLIKTFSQEMKAQGYTKITLVAVVGDPKSHLSHGAYLAKLISFYEKFGCVVTKNYYSLFNLYRYPKAEMECSLVTEISPPTSTRTTTAEQVYGNLFNLYRSAVPGYFDINQ